MTSDESSTAGLRTGSAPVTTPELQVFPVGIGHYSDPAWADLDTEAEARRVADLLAGVGRHAPPGGAPALEGGGRAGGPGPPARAQPRGGPHAARGGPRCSV